MSSSIAAFVVRGSALAGALTALALGVLSCASTAPERALAASHVKHSTHGVSAPMRFAVVADRTGGHRPGVFASAITSLNLLAPDFVMSVGDFIEGYTTDTSELGRQWDEFDAIVENLEPKFIRVPGNHDLSNQESHALWHTRFGPTYFAFVRNQCLFLCLNSEDPTSGHVGPEQLEFVRHALRRNRDVRWTFIFMHEPLWTYAKETGWDSMEALLGDRPRTVFAGHMHKYGRDLRHGFEYITLGTTGGSSPMRGVNYGEVDHIAWVTMADGPPRIANLELNAIWDTSMYTDDVKTALAPAVTGRPVLVDPVLVESSTFQSETTHIHVKNPTAFPLSVTAHTGAAHDTLFMTPDYFHVVVPAGQTSTCAVTLSSFPPLPSETVPAFALEWQATYEVPARPPIITHGIAKAFVVPALLRYEVPKLPENATGAELVDALYDAGHTALAAEAVNVFAPHTRTTADAVALIESARAIGVKDELGPRLGFLMEWQFGEPAVWKFDDGLQGELGPVAEETGLPFRADSDSGIVDLLAAVGDLQDSNIFGKTAIVVDQAGDAVMHLRSDDGIALWLNGERVHANNAIRGVTMAEDHVPVRLRHGRNEVVVEITQGIEGWAFSVRLTRPDGSPYPFATE